LNRQVLERIASIAGVRSATFAGMTPISGAAGSQFINVKGFTENPDDRRRVSLNTVAPKYFETLGTPFIAGRDFALEDEGRSHVAIVNQAMARYYFRMSIPPGRQFTFEGQTRPRALVDDRRSVSHHRSSRARGRRRGREGSLRCGASPAPSVRRGRT